MGPARIRDVLPLLDKKQIDRAREIQAQVEGPAVLLSFQPKDFERLTASQRDRLRDLRAQYIKEELNLFGATFTSPTCGIYDHEAPKRIEKQVEIALECDKQILKVLTEQQRKSWLASLGRPYHGLSTSIREACPNMDASRFVFEATWVPGHSFIAVCNSEGGHRKRIAYGWAWMLRPSWSSRGDMIVYSRLTDIGYDLFVSNLTGGEPRRVTTGRSAADGASFSPDGVRTWFLVMMMVDYARFGWMGHA